MKKHPDTYTLVDRADDSNAGPYRFREIPVTELAAKSADLLTETKNLGNIVFDDRGYLEFGSRLCAIRELGLFKSDGFSSLSKFYEANFGNRGTASRCINSAQFLVSLNGKSAVLPENPFQYEALLPFPTRTAVELWIKAVAENDGTAPTGEWVREFLSKLGLRRRRQKNVSLSSLVDLLSRALRRVTDSKARTILTQCIGDIADLEIQSEGAMGKRQSSPVTPNGPAPVDVQQLRVSASNIAVADAATMKSPQTVSCVEKDFLDSPQSTVPAPDAVLNHAVPAEVPDFPVAASSPSPTGQKLEPLKNAEDSATAPLSPVKVSGPAPIVAESATKETTPTDIPAANTEPPTPFAQTLACGMTEPEMLASFGAFIRLSENPAAAIEVEFKRGANRKD